jgi:hypothetical protein
LASPIRSPLPGHLETLHQPLSMDTTWSSYLHRHPPSPCSEFGYISRAPTSQPPSNFFTTASGGLTSNHTVLQGRGRREEEKGKSSEEEPNCRRRSGHRRRRRRCCLLPRREASVHGRSTSLPRITTAPLSFCHEPKVSRFARKYPLLTTVCTSVPAAAETVPGTAKATPRPPFTFTSHHEHTLEHGTALQSYASAGTPPS